MPLNHWVKFESWGYESHTEVARIYKPGLHGYCRMKTGPGSWKIRFGGLTRTRWPFWLQIFEHTPFISTQI